MPVLEILSAIIGVGGGLAQKYMQAKEETKRLEAEFRLAGAKYAYELQLEDKRLAVLRLEADKGVALGEIAAAKERDVAAYSALTASYAADKATYSNDRPLTPAQTWVLVIVDFARGMTRPGLSWLLVLFLGWQLWVLLPTDPQFALLIDSLRALATTSVTWWFAARGTNEGSGRRRAAAG